MWHSRAASPSRTPLAAVTSPVSNSGCHMRAWGWAGVESVSSTPEMERGGYIRVFAPPNPTRADAKNKAHRNRQPEPVKWSPWQQEESAGDDGDGNSDASAPLLLLPWETALLDCSLSVNPGLFAAFLLSPFIFLLLLLLWFVSRELFRGTASV